MIGYRIRGAALGAVVDRILVRCELLGIEERAGEVDVWLADGSAPLPAVSECTVEPLSAEARSWTEGDAPIRITGDLIVRPPWVPRPAGFAGLDLVVPRGMAFGSGEHESTRLALQLMREQLRGGSLADVGTGSGILALCGRRLGCAPVLACDIDADAVAAARALLPGARVVHGGADALRPFGPCDHVVANMTGAELIACAAALRALWNGRGAVLVSGLRAGERPAVCAALGLATSRVREGEDFLALLFERCRDA